MIRLITILFVFVIFSGEVLASKTVAGEDFYGTWSTSSSVLYPKRQILKLSPDGGRWTQIDDEGGEREYLLSNSDIAIKDDLLIIDYKRPDEGFRLKLILGGWAIGKNKNIFGTVYMYQDRGEGLSLFNGIPISFKSGVEDMPPQIFWAFFSSAEIEHVETGKVKELEDSLKTVDGITVSESPNSTEYSLKSIGAYISITKPGHAAYPSAIGLRQAPGNPAAIETAGIYEGAEEGFKKYYNAYLQDLESQKMEAKSYMEELVKKIEASKVLE